MKIKKIFAAILAYTFICKASFVNEVAYRSSSLITASAATEETGTLRENITWELDDKGTLTISGSGDMPDIIPLPTENVMKVIIGNGITSITALAFYGCENLTSIIIPDSVTSIGDYAFYGCKSLTSITIPDSVTIIDEAAFDDCTSLTSIKIENPECIIYDLSNTIPDTATIYGYKDSTAQNYAEKYERNFILID